MSQLITDNENNDVLDIFLAKKRQEEMNGGLNTRKDVVQEAEVNNNSVKETKDQKYSINHEVNFRHKKGGISVNIVNLLYSNVVIH